jgi:hypothetical protein
VYDAKTCQADWPWSRSEYALASVRRLFIKQRIENFRRHLSKLNRLWAAFPALQEVVTQSPVDLLPIKGLRAHTAIHLTFSIRAGESQWRLPGLRDVYNFAGSATRLVLHIDLMDTWTDSSRRDKSLRAKAAAFDKDSKLRSVAIIFGRHDILSIRHSPVFRIHTFVRDLANHILQFPACAYEIVNAATLNERDFCVGMGTDPLPSDRAHALLRQVLCDALSCTTDLRTAQKHLETVRFLTFAQQVGSHTEIDLGRWSSWGALERRSAVFQHASTFRSLLKS